METFTTPTWGYKIITNETLNFYHVLLPQVPLRALFEEIPVIEHIKQENDGSITISTHKEEIHTVVQIIIGFFQAKALEFIDTPKSYYKIDSNKKHVLTWGLTFEGCLGILLEHDPDINPLLQNSWEYINSYSGGLYLPPYTLLLYEDYPKIVHPVSINNFDARKTIEQKTSSMIRKMMKRINQAQEGLEGIALLSLIESKTPLSATDAVRILNNKSFQIKAPTYSPFFKKFA
ncbi:MAG: hypothetical protein HYT10_02980 [Candidatus Levybacteria bacterium]|nr:hypothetical protein [Candidatus Levybacteria bacterium]